MTGATDRRGFDPDGSPDRPLLDLIRRRGPLTVAEMASELGVTATAVRNRLARLCGSGMVERRAEHGRPEPQRRSLARDRSEEDARPEREDRELDRGSRRERGVREDGSGEAQEDEHEKDGRDRVSLPEYSPNGDQQQ